MDIYLHKEGLALALGFGKEFFRCDGKALMRAGTDLLAGIVCRDLEVDLASVDRRDLGDGADGQSDGRCGTVADRECSADGRPSGGAFALA